MATYYVAIIAHNSNMASLACIDVIIISYYYYYYVH